eukprot:1890832-Pleurochrysis_carterae.AAC.1
MVKTEPSTQERAMDFDLRHFAGALRCAGEAYALRLARVGTFVRPDVVSCARACRPTSYA